jgi:hypothetical protein
MASILRICTAWGLLALFASVQLHGHVHRWSEPKASTAGRLDAPAEVGAEHRCGGPVPHLHASVPVLEETCFICSSLRRDRGSPPPARPTAAPAVSRQGLGSAAGQLSPASRITAAIGPRAPPRA